VGTWCSAGRAAGHRQNLLLTFLYHAVVSFFIAYIAVHSLQGGTPYLQVFRVTGAIAFWPTRRR
jgi:hypothetical protein